MSSPCVGNTGAEARGTIVTRPRRRNRRRFGAAP
jgi:hypothetical protein